MGTTYLHAVASLDGYIANEGDDVGPLHDWYFKGDHPLVDEDHADVHGAPFRVSAASADYVRGMWSRQRVLVIGRHQFDLTNGWEGHPPASDHVVVVSHRPRPTGWHPEASYHFATSVEEGIARAQELAEKRVEPEHDAEQAGAEQAGADPEPQQQTRRDVAQRLVSRLPGRVPAYRLRAERR
jgi:dihydrofolate reductase